MARLGGLEALSGKHGPRHARVEHSVAIVLEPLFQQPDMRGSSDTVGAFDHDKFSLKLFEVYFGEAFFTIVLKSSHVRILVFLVPASASVTIWRICTCCSSID